MYKIELSFTVDGDVEDLANTVDMLTSGISIIPITLKTSNADGETIIEFNGTYTEIRRLINAYAWGSPSMRHDLHAMIKGA